MLNGGDALHENKVTKSVRMLTLSHLTSDLHFCQTLFVLIRFA